MATSPVHRLVDPGGSKYLPFAESKREQLRRVLGGADYTRIFKHSGFTITVSRRGGQEFIHIKGQQLFEFYTSGWPVTTENVTQGDFAVDSYDVGIVSAVIKGKKIEASFVGDQRLSYAAGKKSASDFGRQEWQVQLGQIPNVDVLSVGGKRKFKYTISHVNPPVTGHSFAHVLMPFWEPGNYDAPWVRTDVPAPMPTLFTARDMGYDALSPRKPGGSMDGVAHVLAPNSDWPRVWGIQEVDAGDGVKFYYGIYVDATGSFYAFPLEEMGIVEADVEGVPIPNLTPGEYRKVTPTYPSWVWRGDGGNQKLVDQAEEIDASETKLGSRNPEFMWSFRHDGKRAATIAYARYNWGAFNNSWYPKPGEAETPQGFQEHFSATNPWPVPAGVTPFANGFANGYVEWSGGLPYNYAGPGVIEAIPVITVTGSNPTDFEFTVTVRSVIDPTQDLVPAPLAVGYLWHKPDGEHAVEEGDMLILEAMFYFSTSGGNYYSFRQMSLRNKTSEQLIFPDILGYVRGLDLRTMSMYIVNGMGSNNGPVRHVPMGTYFAGKPLPATWEGYALNGFDEPFFTYRPVAFAIIKGKLAKVFMPDDIPAEMTNVATKVAAITLEEIVNSGLNDGVPVDATPMYVGTQWTTAMMRDYTLDTDGEVVSSAELSARYWAFTLYFGNGAYRAMQWSDPPAGLAGYPVGWMAAAQNVLNYMRIPLADTTFYVHPSGSWALFDSNILYNTLGVPRWESTVGWRQIMYGQPGVELTSEHFKWFPIDHVHIRGARPTTFVELYNKAQAAHLSSAADRGEQPQFQPLVLADTLPTFTLHTQFSLNWTVDDDGDPTEHGTTEYTLGIHWTDGSSRYRRLPAYRTGGMFMPYTDSMLVFPWTWDGWCLHGDANDMMYHDPACTEMYATDGMFYRYTFRVSSPRLIAAPSRN